MKLITTHLGADFDALGAVVGATLLVPGGRVVFPGSQEVAVRRFLAAEHVHLPEIRVRELRRITIASATVVDCSSVRRLGEVGELIVGSGCPVDVIDHHPEGADPIAGASVLTAPVAATCTVVTEELQRRGIVPDGMAASMLLLGIYEDTGGLTYADTTPQDVRAAAWLLERGARLDWVRRYVLRPLEPGQLELLNRLVEGAVEHRVGGARVVISVAHPSEHVEEAAYVVHRYAEIFDLPVVLAILEAPPQLVVIARSTHPAVDAGKLLTEFGGGGHATAAACRVRGLSAVELAERLLSRIRKLLSESWTVGALANPHLHTCPAGATVAAAKDRLIRLRINAMPVQSNGDLLGVVTRQILDNAMSHGMGERPVTTVMTPGVPRLAADAPVEEAERLFMEVGARLAVVTLPGGLGVVTRMDLFRRLYQKQLTEGARLDRRVAGARPAVRPEGPRIRRALAPRLLDVLETVGVIARELGMRAYLVGGAVRDALLDRDLGDVDVVVEGNGMELAAQLVKRVGGRYHPHEPFMTAAVQLEDGLRIDVATARTEFYRSPAALPEVETSAMRQDLYRRDFTINAMAVNLAPERFGELLDFFGGLRDLEQREIRVLHSLSFLDDPTRMIRAVRFATRLGFTIGAETRHLIRVAVSEAVFVSLTGERLRDELILLLEEGRPVESLAELERVAGLGSILPRLRWSERLGRFLHEVEAMTSWSRLEGVYDGPRWLMYLTALATRLGEDAAGQLVGRLALSGDVAATVAGARAGVEQILARVAVERPVPSEVACILERSRPAWRVVAMAQAGERGRRILHKALTDWVRRPLPVTGGDLVKAGVTPGPAVGEAVRRTRAAMLDGGVAGGDALSYALAVARSLEGSG